VPEFKEERYWRRYTSGAPARCTRGIGYSREAGQGKGLFYIDLNLRMIKGRQFQEKRENPPRREERDSSANKKVGPATREQQHDVVSYYFFAGI